MLKKNEIKVKRPNGRPTKWTEEECDKLADRMNDFFIKARADFMAITKDFTGIRTIPFLSKFCRDNDISHDTMLVKADLYPKLSESLKRAKEIQKEILIAGGLSGIFNPTAFIFTAKNMTDMRDRNETDITTNGEKIGGFILTKRHDKDNLPRSESNL